MPPQDPQANPSKPSILRTLFGGVFVAAALAFLPGPASASGSNIASNLEFPFKVATASATSATRPVARLIDGNVNASPAAASIGEALPVFSSALNKNISYVDINFGRERQIERVELRFINDLCASSGGSCHSADVSVVVGSVKAIDSDATNPRAEVSALPASNAARVSTAAKRTFMFHRPGNWVRVQANDGKALVLAEILVFEKNNALTFRTVSLSSTDGAQAASRAIDGKTDIRGSAGSVARTTSQFQPFFQADMGASKAIRKVELWLAGDGYRIPKAWLLLSENPMPTTASLDTLMGSGVVRAIPIADQSSGVLAFDLAGVFKRARHVRVQVEGTGVLALAEAQVWTMGSATNLSAFPTATNLQVIDANHLIDGDLEKVTTTPAIGISNVEVDLGSVRTIETLNLWNIAGCGTSCTGINVIVSSKKPSQLTGADFATRARGFVIQSSGNAPRVLSIPFGFDARFIRVEKLASSSSTPLQIGEIEVASREGMISSLANGSTFSGEPSAFGNQRFVGFVGEPGRVELQVLDHPTSADPDDTSKWRFAADMAIASSPALSSARANGIMTSFSATPVPPFPSAVTWARGGLLRLRAVLVDDEGKRVILDSSEPANRASPFSPTLGLVSTIINPTAKISGAFPPNANDLASAPSYLDRKLFDDADNQDAAGLAYYKSTGIATRFPSLQAFANVFGLSLPKGIASALGNSSLANKRPDELTARYYNRGDLGIGREMHCKKVGVEVGCFVSNYLPLVNGKGRFGDRDQSMALLENGSPPATVAMVWNPNATTDRKTLFIVYSGTKNEVLTPTFALDNQGSNKSVPGNCMTCHGSSGDIKRGTDNRPTGSTNSFFLPFDLNAFDFLASPGNTKADQEESFRQLNNLIREATTPMGRLFVSASYGGSSSTVGTKFVSDSVLPFWAYNDYTRDLYRKVYRPYCQTCHISHTGSLKLDKYDTFVLNKNLIVNSVCRSKGMPNAEQTLREMWHSPARAYLSEFLSLPGDCKP